MNRTDSPWDSATLHPLIRELVGIRKQLLQAESKAARLLRGVHASHLKSARNLMHYLALRRVDLRSLQPRLTALGLSSLGRSEAHVIATLDAVLRILCDLVRERWPASMKPGPVGFAEGRAALKKRTLELLGPKGSGRWVRIMVTMPTEAAESPALVRQLVDAGMNCMRVNCAHDDVAAWRKMVRHLRAAERQTGLRCRALFDLRGPKMRTGPLAPGPQILKWRPKRNAFGKVIAPTRLWLTPVENAEAPPRVADAVLPFPRAWLSQLRNGDRIRFLDSRGSSRKLTVTFANGGSRWAECRNTAYVEPGTEFTLDSVDRADRGRARIGNLPGCERPIVLHIGDTLVLTRKPEVGRGALLDDQGKVKRPAQISCASPAVFQNVKTGERVWFDDGKIGAVIKSATPTRLTLRITLARAKGEKLRSDKGINFPDTALRLPALSAEDLRNLPEVARRADIIGYSFVRTARDVAELQRRLHRLRSSRLGIILKIETRTAFEHLPELLLAAMRSGFRRRHDRSWRSGGRVRFRTNGRDSGGNLVALRGGACACDLGNPGAGYCAPFQVDAFSVDSSMNS